MHRWLEANGRRVNVFLKDFRAARDNEWDRFNVGVINGLEGSSDFVFMGL